MVQHECRPNVELIIAAKTPPIIEPAYPAIEQAGVNGNGAEQASIYTCGKLAEYHGRTEQEVVDELNQQAEKGWLPRVSDKAVPLRPRSTWRGTF